MNPAPARRSAARQRLDRAVVAAGLAPTREKAQALIMAGRVTVDGRRAEKPGALVPGEATLDLLPGRPEFVSRGGLKLAGAVERLGLDLNGRRCLDVGASTGGFTDFLLHAGASHVTAVDVGRGLLDASLRGDPRVRLVEGVNARELAPGQVDPPYDLVVVDVSFISLTLVLPRLTPLAPRGAVLALVKPQFEVGRKEVSRGAGVIRDPELRARAVRTVAECFRAQGWGVRDVVASPVAGPRGNREIFVLAAAGPGLDAAALDARILEEVQRDRT